MAVLSAEKLVFCYSVLSVLYVFVFIYIYIDMANSGIVDLTFMIAAFMFTGISLLAATVKYSK